MNAVISAGVLPMASAERSARRFCTSGSFSTSATAAEFLSAIRIGDVRGAPVMIAERFSPAVGEVLKLPDVQKRLADLSAEAIGNTPAQMAAFMKKDAERWK